VLPCQIWSFYIKPYESNDRDMPKKSDPSCPAFQGHSRSMELTRIDRQPMTSYYWSIVTMSLSRTVSEINGDLSRKLQMFPTAVSTTGSGFSIGLHKKIQDFHAVMTDQKVSRWVVYYFYPRRARSALGVDTVLTLDVCMFVCMFVCLYVC